MFCQVSLDKPHAVFKSEDYDVFSYKFNIKRHCTHVGKLPIFIVVSSIFISSSE